ALDVRPGASLEATRIVARATTAAAIHVAGARANLDGAVIDGTLALSTSTATISATFVRGPLHASGGVVTIDSSELTAITATASANISGRDLVVRGGGDGPAISAGPAQLTLSRVRADFPHDGFRLEGGTTTLTDVLASAPEGRALDLSGGTFVIGENVLIEGP